MHVHDKTAFLCGSAENEADVLDLFALVVCLVIDYRDAPAPSA